MSSTCVEGGWRCGEHAGALGRTRRIEHLGGFRREEQLARVGVVHGLHVIEVVLLRVPVKRHAVRVVGTLLLATVGPGVGQGCSERWCGGWWRWGGWFEGRISHLEVINGNQW